MIPLKDNIRSRTVPLVNYVMIGSCSLVFLLQLQEDPQAGGSLIERYGMIPKRVLSPDEPIYIESLRMDRVGRVWRMREEAEKPPFTPLLTLLTCIFLHGGWLHFIGNMWFLYIFGDNVEDRLGHVGYLLFYVFTGVAASAAHLVTNTASEIPTIGASGAIAGVMGAYFLLYPRATVLTLVPIFFFIQILVLPAPLFLGVWFLLQFFQGTMAISSMETGGVAWWAHIGGFVAGIVLVHVLRTTGRLRPQNVTIVPGTTHMSRYRRYGPWGGGRR